MTYQTSYEKAIQEALDMGYDLPSAKRVAGHIATQDSDSYFYDDRPDSDYRFSNDFAKDRD